MANLADLQRANEGRHTWNEWAKAQLQVGATPAVDFSEAPIEATNFGGFIFPGLANFTKAQFQGAASFEGAEFCELASFEKASFLKPAVFAKTSFKQGASFYHTVFHSTAFFVRAVFNEATAGSNDLRNRPVFSGAQFVGDALFSSVIFYAGIAMDRARFEQDARFNGVQFKRFADVTHAEFLKFATFEAANFEGKLVLTGSTFLGETDFTHVSFSDSEFGGVKFEHALTRFASASFKCVPDFRGSIFKTPPSFHNVKVDDVEYVRGSGPPIWHRWIARATSAEDAARFRRLKQLAIDGRDHERELEFFAKELRAKRIHETPGFWSNCLNLAYEFLSDFGRSVARPLLLLLVVTLLSAGAILLRSSALCAMAFEGMLSALVLSVADAALLLGSDKWYIRKDACDALCECKFGVGAGSLAYLQSAASLLLLFLAGLGLRNRFRTGGSN